MPTMTRAQPGARSAPDGRPGSAANRSQAADRLPAAARLTAADRSIAADRSPAAGRAKPAGRLRPTGRARPAANADLPEVPAGLRYVDDAGPGIRRRLVRGKFAYFDASGQRIRDAREIARIQALAIPPAYADVWICPDPRGHIQATGRDARGRKQYRYHARWREVRDATKYGRMLAFGEALPRVRARVARDLGLPGMPRDKVLATVLRLMDETAIRVGNEEYARTNGSFGLTTLRNRHAQVKGDRIRLKFRGKSGVRHDVTVQDPRVARIVRRCIDLPGQELFQYLDDEGEARAIGSADVNAYLQDAAGGEFTAKDYRTWIGSAQALERLRALTWESDAEAKRLLTAAVAEVAQRLGNTPAVCRKCYVHPAIFEAFLARRLSGLPEAHAAGELRPEERSLLAFLEAARDEAAGSA